MRRFTLLSTICLALFLSAAAAAHDPIRAEFTTKDGVSIVGDYWTPIDMKQKAPVVVLLHMYRSDRHAWEPLVPALEEAGFAILAIDLRGHGESVKPASKDLQKLVFSRDEKIFSAMHLDVAAAYNWLAGRDEADLSRVALVGASVGCSVSLDYAARDRSVDVVVLMTPGKNYLGVDSAKHIKKFGNRPVLMLSSEEERSGGTDFLSSKAARAEVKIYPQSGVHGTKMFGKVAGVEKQIADYLKANVGAPSSEFVYASVKSDVFHPAGSRMLSRIKKENLRVFSSAAEAQQRGLRPAKDRPSRKGFAPAKPNPRDAKKKVDDDDDF